MNLLFDQNISFRIVKKIADIFPGSKQVRELNLTDATDIEIWNYAKDNSYSIVTFDSDFIDISNLQGTPPKIIWLHTGNTSTESIVSILRRDSEIIKSFLENPDIAFLEIL